jgi:hypothetical protein
VQLGLTSAGTTPFLVGNTDFKMYIRLSTTNYGLIFFTTPVYTASSSFTWLAPTCSLNPDTLVIGCATSTGLSRFLQCGSSFYMASAATTPGGCVEVHLKVAA